MGPKEGGEIGVQWSKVKRGKNKRVGKKDKLVKSGKK